MKSSRRKGNRDRANKASMDLEDLEVELVLKKKYLKRFTKMMLSRELRSFVEQEMTVLLSALSSYASASVIAYQQLQNVWEEAGKKMCSNFSSMKEQSQKNYEQMKDMLMKEQVRQWEKEESVDESESDESKSSEEESSEIEEESSEIEEESSESDVESSESSEEEKPKKNKKNKKSKKSKESDDSSSEVAL